MEPNSEGLEDSRAPFLEHLEELRWRIWRGLLGVIIAGLVCFAFSDFLYDFFTAPLYEVLENNRERLGEDAKLVSRTVAGAFMFHFKIALIGGIFFGIPVVLYQAWQFIVPGLYQHERKFAIPFVAISTVCFIGGGLFAYYLVLPSIFDFLIGYSIRTGPHKLVPEIAVEDYLGITTKLLLAFGAIFEMPVIIAFLSWIGMITHRSLLAFFRWAVVLAFVLGAALTPPDIVSQLFLAGPLVILYGLSIGIAYLITKRNERLLSDDDDDDDDDDDPDPDDNEPDPDDGGRGGKPQPSGSGPSTPPAPRREAEHSGADVPGSTPQSHDAKSEPIHSDGADSDPPSYDAGFAERQLQMPFEGNDDVEDGHSTNGSSADQDPSE